MQLIGRRAPTVTARGTANPRRSWAHRREPWAPRARYHLRQMLVFLNMFPINQPEVMIAHAEERFDQEGNLTDVITKEFILALLQSLVEWTRRIDTSAPQSRVKDI